MYGFIYNTLRNLVLEKFDEETWIQICDECGVTEMKEGILDRQYYDESYLHTVGTMASQKLGITMETLMTMFGAFFFETCKKSGHSSILRTLGHNLYGFLLNLDTLHDHLSFTYTQMRAPSFRCEKTEDGQSLILYYYSRRHGLSHIVVGIVKAVARDFFQLDIIIKQIYYEEDVGNKLCHQYVFSIEVEESAKTDNYLERLTGEIGPDVLNMLSPVDEMDVPSDGEGESVAPAQHPRVLNIKKSPSAASPHISFASDVKYPAAKDDDKAASVIESSGEEGCPFKFGGAAKGGGEDLAADRPNLSHGLKDVIREEIRKVSGDMSSGQMPRPQLPAFSMSRFQSRRGSMAPWDSNDWPITPHLFQLCFPFHIIFDNDLTIRYLGISLTRLLSKSYLSGKAKLTDYFELDRPRISFNYHNICTSLHNSFVLYTKPSVVFPSSVSDGGPLYFRGQMILTSRHEGSHILFLCSPRVSSVEELEHQGLYLSDIPVHDVTRDLLLLNRHFRVEMNIAAELEQTKNALEVQKAMVEQEKQRADKLLHSMLPPSIAHELKTKGEATATYYKSVSVLFSDIKKFTNICSSCKPMQVVGMLNSLYTLYDVQSERHNVYKVETIGDAYMVAAGLLDTSVEHAQATANMAFGMMKESVKVLEPVTLVPLQVRIGIHTGPIVAGVVGRKMPRFCLFGDTVNTASRMESHGEPDKVHISDTTYMELRHNPNYIFESRGRIPVKGLGERETYFIELKDPDSITACDLQPDDGYLHLTDMESEADLPQVDQCLLAKVSPRTRQKPPSPFFTDFVPDDDDQKPMVVDMIKPQAPEGAWGKTPPSSSCSAEPIALSYTSTVMPQPQDALGKTPLLGFGSAEPLPHTSSTEPQPQDALGKNPPSGSDSAEPLPCASSTEMPQPKARQLAASVTPRVSKVTPAAETGGEASGPAETVRNNPSLFIASSPPVGSGAAEQQEIEGSADSRGKGKGKCVLC